jgi:hypothetical protein
MSRNVYYLWHFNSKVSDSVAQMGASMTFEGSKNICTTRIVSVHARLHCPTEDVFSPPKQVSEAQNEQLFRIHAPPILGEFQLCSLAPLTSKVMLGES